MTVSNHNLSARAGDSVSNSDWLQKCGDTHGDCWCETKAMADVWRIMTDGDSRWKGHAMRGTIVSCTGAFVGKGARS